MSVRKSIQKETPVSNPVRPRAICDAFGTRLDQLSIELGFCRALVDILCFEKKSEATEESFSTIKFKLWELVGEASSEAEQLSMDLIDVVKEAAEVSA